MAAVLGELGLSPAGGHPRLAAVGAAAILRARRTSPAAAGPACV